MAQNTKEKEINTNKNVVIGHKAESKAGRSPEADIGPNRRERKQETIHSPRRQKMRVDWSGDQPPERKRSKTIRPIHKTDKP